MEGTEIPASADFVVDSNRCTTLGKAGVRLSTVEHVLAALAGCHIDNAIVEVEGPEMPILDGSSLPIIEAIADAGISPQPAAPRYIAVTKALRTASDNGSSWLTAEPGDGFELTVETQFNDWPQGDARHTVDLSSGRVAFEAEFAMARTFAFYAEVAPLLAAGLAKGGSLDNVVIITPPDTFSTSLRIPGEWWRHKALDVVGDLALVNARLACRIVAYRPGHTVNTRMAKALLELGVMSGS